MSKSRLKFAHTTSVLNLMADLFFWFVRITVEVLRRREKVIEVKVDEGIIYLLIHYTIFEEERLPSKALDTSDYQPLWYVNTS